MYIYVYLNTYTYIYIYIYKYIHIHIGQMQWAIPQHNLQGGQNPNMMNMPPQGNIQNGGDIPHIPRGKYQNRGEFQNGLVLYEFICL
jgi:hypothetical protein